MERASLVLAKLKGASQNATTEQLASAAWPVAVGSKIAQHTNVIGLVGSRLVVEVEDNIWQRQLWALRSQILGVLEKTLGKPPLVTELEFRIAGPSRRPPRAAEQRQSVMQAADEADSIRDPVMRSIYKAARKKATA